MNQLPTWSTDSIPWDLLLQEAKYRLRTSDAWVPTARRSQNVTSGWIDHCPVRIYRADLDVGRSAADVAHWLADDMFVHLGKWNREYLHGEIMRCLWNEPDDRAWLMRVIYHTPPPLADREYVYALRRVDDDDGHWILYQSVSDGPPVPAGCERGILSGTVHHVQPAQGGCHVRHLLITDLGGSLPLWVQNHVFAPGVVAANRRDLAAQARLLQ
jgi:hypothetical protein